VQNFSKSRNLLFKVGRNGHRGVIVQRSVARERKSAADCAAKIHVMVQRSKPGIATPSAVKVRK